MSTTTEPIVKEEVATTPQVVEAPTEETVKTENVKTEEPAAATTEEAAETSVGETTTTPNPTTSKSNPTNRLSLFLGKAKTFVEKVHEKKPAVPKKETAAEEAVETTTEPVVTSPVTEEAPVTTEEPVTREVETKVPKAEKRKSILAGIFRSKSPVNKEVEKSEDVTPATEVAKPDETVADKETQETSAAVTGTSGVVEEEPTVEQPEKENVIDHIKRGPLGKFFNKKKETEHKEEPVAATVETEAAPVITEPVVTEETPAAEVDEPVVESTTTSAPAQPEEKVARSGSPLGRRITQMFRGFSSKKKVPTVAATEEAAKEENTREIIAADTAAEEAPAATEAPAAIEAPVAAKEEEEQQKEPADVAVPAEVPSAQPTA